ncbi:hypothetical protein U9R90_30885 [Streptomyces sp. E11-3]|uniref:hypothetical protein n=1 Tax=Streptomyces sp. E11-3 TaxID=3110112 RepID=UPI00397FA961
MSEQKKTKTQKPTDVTTQDNHMPSEPVDITTQDNQLPSEPKTDDPILKPQDNHMP